MKNNKSIDPDIFRLMIEQTKDYALLVLDPQGHITTWNLGAQRIKGYFAEEIIGRHFSVFYTADAVRSGWPEYELKTAIAEGSFEDESWRIRKDGSRFWASVIITALRDTDGKLLGFSKITRDLSERKMQEETLRQSEERFRLLIEGVTDCAIYMLDAGGIISSWNPGAERIKGYSREEIIGKHFSRFYRAEDIAAGKPWQELATARNTGRAEDEGWRVKKSGELFWARVVVTSLHDEDGHLRGFAKVTQDISERRQVKDLERAAQNINEFIATLAHEIRNPLAPIRSAIQVMAALPVDDPTHEIMRDMIDRQSAHLARIVDDMIDVSRISRGLLSIDYDPVDISEAVRRSVEAATPLIKTRKHRLKINLPEHPLFVKGDVNRLTQLLTNLLNNAARYTDEDGAIQITVGTEGDNVTVRIKDTGRGIAPDMIESIFDMFVQGRGALERAGSGLGIGLALTRKIAELHGGSIHAFSAGTGKGSEFTFSMPQMPVQNDFADHAVRARAVPVAAPMDAQRVLIVDDNVDAAASLDLLLKSLGHQTCVVNDGANALEMAVAFHPDIVLLDISMPGIDGYEVARRLRKLKKEGELRIVAITGWGQEADRLKAKDAGFDLHLLKPVDLDHLMLAIAQGNTTVH